MQKLKLVFWQILIIILVVGNLESADFKILFSANINGNLENCNCGKSYNNSVQFVCLIHDFPPKIFMVMNAQLIV